ncbi:Gfo/Idh/MocA family protein [Hufsiella ginkgonis]|uniref:Gfo/Idh/MocA family oxidoreductase n=1 Tax=Hufsiella ginkgonis TaxID=2695274 RepID=A0A7K1XWR7_9SPHI|nr:Gfo/Idh/MocA family oxidoreductase [Hufsiella ginkgonis]MXV15410.1 Gfo/Idh/MocA family oxidoreductase [Hufsiella ginkgonis]
MQPISTGILSYGMSGRIFHAPFVAAHPGFKFHSVTERSVKKVNERYPGVISYDDVASLLADDALELVIVNTPNDTHYPLAKQALLAGKHVLVEKPFAATAVEGKELFSLAREMDRHVMVYQNRRWDSDFQSVKSVIESGELGKLIEVNFRFDRYRREISVKKFKEELVPATGLTYDLGPHLLDQVISLFGKPLQSRKVTGTFREGSKVDDYMSFQLTFEGNVNVFVTSSLLTAKPLPSFVIHGANGSFIKDRVDVQEAQLDAGTLPTDASYGVEHAGSEGALTVVAPDGTKTTSAITAPKGNYMGLFDAVHVQIRNGVPYPVKEEQVIWQLELLQMS